MNSLIAYVDGGSRGNPGVAGYGAHILDEEGNKLAALSHNIGIRTNNQAEYSGLIAALDYAHINHFDKVKVFADSELMVRQINGLYKVKNPKLKRLFEQARLLIDCFKVFSIQYVPREHNCEADRLANLAMDDPVK